MKTVQISLNSIDKVKAFVNDITKFDYDFDLVSPFTPRRQPINKTAKYPSASAMRPPDAMGI